jgi:diguanylate cyclase (GGDEF)-like protein/PAS domain S-box-containing protein
MILVMEADGAVRYISPAVEQVLGYRPEVVISKGAFDMVHPDDMPGMQDFVAKAIRNPGITPRLELRLRHADGSWRHVESACTSVLDNPAVSGIVINSRDITEKKTFEERLKHQAFYDNLTGLPNRTLFLERLGHALTRSDRRGGEFAVLFVDIDDFKTVNDSLGHEAGDRLLMAIAERLRACVRPGDTVARVFGDEFAVLLEGVAEGSRATKAAERMIEKLRREPFVVQEREVFITPSVGIALGTPGEEQQPEELLRRADVAMYEAKKRGEAQQVAFDPSMDRRTLEHLSLRTDLRRALKDEEFRLLYQPKVSLKSGEIVGMEALVRWEHPERGLVPPSEFLAMAEQTGVIVPLGRWVLKEACRQAKEWQERYPNEPPLAMSVNLSARDFRRRNLVEDVRAVLRECALDPRSLTLEITESTVMEDASATIDALRRLKRLGVRIAIDDFGTGFSSLSYLRRFPVDYLKVDRAFVGGLGRNPEDEGIVKAVTELAHTLGLRVVAEGVENGEQLKLVREMGCELAQGCYFWGPLPPEAAGELVVAYNSY